MGDIFFFLRMLAITVVVVLLMQIHWDNDTIETHAMDFLTSSAVVKPIDETAGAAVKVIRNTWRKVTSSINTNFMRALREENQPGARHKIFSVKRAQEYAEEKTEQAKSAAERMKDSVQKKWNDKFIDETRNPGAAVETSAASNTSDVDESIED